jgi:diguanylate cyclase (GGDEF)-like protein
MTKDSRNLLERKFFWGDMGSLPEFFTPDECWGLRQGKAYFSAPDSTFPICSHADSREVKKHICVPLTAFGEIQGLLYLNCLDNSSRNPNLPECTLDEFPIENMAEAFSEQVSLSLSNITLHDKLQNQAVHDQLTGLYNRTYLQETLEREMSRAQRRKSRVSLVMMDLDHFKKLNDTYGHAAGDLVLQTVAQVMKSFFRPEDFCCRYGGEEFLVLLPDASAQDSANRLDKLRQEISSLALRYRDQSIGKVTISIGIAVFPDHGKDATLAVRASDEAVYRANSSFMNIF